MGVLGFIKDAVGGVTDALGFKMEQDEATKKAREQLLALGKQDPLQWGPQSYASSDYDTLNKYQRPLADRLNALAEGRGPSAAQLQMQDAMDRASATQGSLARGAVSRGVGAGAAFRNAGNMAANIQAQGARDAAIVRSQEQLQANQLLGGVAQGMRQQYENLEQFNTGQANQRQTAMIEAELARRGLSLQALSSAAGTGTTSPGLGMQAAALVGGILSSRNRGGGGGG